jgi:hypothetical protein
MEQQSGDAAAKALAFANGLRRNVTAAGRRWSQWPGGAHTLAIVNGCIDAIQLRLQDSLSAGSDEADVAACIADLRTVLEWTMYQSSSLATARAIVFARKIRAFAKRFGLVDERVSGLTTLAESEESLIENVETKNGYMIALAERSPHLGLPQPLVSVESLAPKVEKPPGRLALIQQLTKNAKRRK